MVKFCKFISVCILIAGLVSGFIAAMIVDRIGRPDFSLWIFTQYGLVSLLIFSIAWNISDITEAARRYMQRIEQPPISNSVETISDSGNKETDFTGNQASSMPGFPKTTDSYNDTAVAPQDRLIVCSKCGNKNPSFEVSCVKCGASLL